MRKAAILIAMFVPVLAQASPSLSSGSVIQAQLALRDVLYGAIAHLVERSPEPIKQDLSILTTQPVADTESSGYGLREDPMNGRAKFHYGTDFRADPGTPVVAAGDGVVIFAGRRGGYGNYVMIDHGGGVVTCYGHMRRIQTQEGAVLSAGDRVGQVGSTGRSTGPHLHFEVRLDSRPVDPNTAMVIGELARENPAAARIAAFALVPELQSLARDRQDEKFGSRPERRHAPKRSQALW